MFVKLTRHFDGLSLFVNPLLVSGITPHNDHSCVWCCDTEREPFEVKESTEEIVRKMEEELRCEEVNVYVH